MTRFLISRSARCLVLMLGVWTMTARAQVNQVLSFSCQNPNQPATCPQGESPAGMIQASDGKFYGIAKGGGSQIQALIFKLTPGGQYTVLFTFSISSNDTPDSGLVEAPDGTLWGTASGGDGNTSDIGFVYKISKDGTGFQNVHSFARTASTEFRFHESLMVGKDGNIYGASFGGGFVSNAAGCPYGCGTVYRIVPATGAYTLLQELRGTNGSGPSRMTQASDGNLYGVTQTTLYRVTPVGKYATVAKLPAVAYFNDTIMSGSGGLVGVIQGSNGRLLSIVQNSSIEPALIEMSLNGKQMQVFPGISSLQRSNAVSDLLQAADRTLWFTSLGAQSSMGSLVQISSTNGAPLQNIAFVGTNGQNPNSGLFLGTDGNLYGTTLFGGVVSSGTASGLVYNINPSH